MASSESENSPTTPDERGEEEQETKREVKIQSTDPEVNGEMVRKQLIVAVEGTAAVGPFWQTIFSDYLEKIVRCFCGNNPAGEKQSKDPPELSLIMFNSHGSYSACLVQRSGWTTDCEVFFQWLLALPFGGGGFNDAAIAEGLAEALMMFSAAHGNKNQAGDVQRHCILIAASNPYPLPTPVYRPQIQNLEKSDGTDPQPDNRLYDAETLAKYFPQCAVSLSVICPKQLQKLRGIYNAGKQNPRAADPVVDNVKNRHFLVLISENFMEARASLSRSGMTTLPSNQSPVKTDAIPVPSISGPSPAPIPIANGSTLVRPPISVGPIPPTIAPPATVKVEPTTLPSVAGPTFPHISSVPRAAPQPVPTLQASSPLSTSQDMNPSNETVLDMKPLVPPSMRQPGNAAPPNVRILNDVARQALAGGTSIGLPSMGVPPMLSNMISSGMASANPTTQASMLSNMISSGMASSNTVPSQTVITSGPAGVTPMSGPSTIPANAQVVQNSAPASFIPSTTTVAANTIIGMSQPMTNPQGSSPMDQNLPGMSQGNVPVSQMVHSGMGMNNQSMMNTVASGMASGTGGTMMTIPGMSQQGQPGMQQPVGVNGNNTMTNMPLPQQTSSALQSAQSKYIKVWEGSLSGQRQGQPVFIARLEGYRSSSAADSLAANWPQTMQIVRLISQDHMNNKQYVGKADFLVFRAMNQHGFLVQLQEKKLCAVIQLPSQTLLLSVSDKAHRLIGMLFPGDMVVFKPQPNQQLQAQLQQQPLQQQNLGQQQMPQNLGQQQMPQNLQPMQQQPPTQQNQMQQQQQQQAILQMQQQQQNQMPQIQQQQNQMPQIQQQQNQMPQIQQPQQQPQQQQMMVGPGMNQQQAVPYMQGRPQLGQVPAQGQPSMSGGGGGGGFMS